MYPILRLAKAIFNAKPSSSGPFETLVTHHMCWPWDLDPWRELNNGRTLTLYDLGRIPLSITVGLIPALKAQGWGMTVAGSTVRYRRRIRMFHRFEIRSRLLGWDGRFIYVEQSMWRKGEALNHLLARLAIVDENGIVAPAEMARAMGMETTSPEFPHWVEAWRASEDQRPWPPQFD